MPASVFPECMIELAMPALWKSVSDIHDSICLALVGLDRALQYRQAAAPLNKICVKE